MKAQGVVRARFFKQRKAGPTLGKKVLGVHFQKGQRRKPLQQFLVVRVAPANSGTLRHHFFILALASSLLMPFMFLHSPLATYFHSSAALSVVD
jgi:hypothetical protein